MGLVSCRDGLRRRDEESGGEDGEEDGKEDGEDCCREPRRSARWWVSTRQLVEIPRLAFVGRIHWSKEPMLRRLIPPAKFFNLTFIFNSLQHHQTTTNIDAVFFIVSASAGSIQ
jgi:hypothetical protein